MEQIIYSLLRRTPMLLLCVIGIAVALIRWRVHPRVSLLVLIAMAMELFLSILFTFVFYGMGTFAVRYGIENSWWLYTVLYFVQDILFSIVLILLIRAALIHRNVSGHAIIA